MAVRRGSPRTSRPSLTVEGRVTRVRRRIGGWRLRLADTGGALAAAEIRRPGPFLPRVGARIALKGHIRYDEAHDWYIVDPVDEWIEVSE